MAKQQRGFRIKIDLDIEPEDDGRFLADIRSIPGAMAYGPTRQQAVMNALAVLFDETAQQMRDGEGMPTSMTLDGGAQFAPDMFELLAHLLRRGKVGVKLHAKAASRRNAPSQVDEVLVEA